MSVELWLKNGKMTETYKLKKNGGIKSLLIIVTKMNAADVLSLNYMTK